MSAGEVVDACTKLVLIATLRDYRDGGRGDFNYRTRTDAAPRHAIPINYYPFVVQRAPQTLHNYPAR